MYRVIFDKRIKPLKSIYIPDLQVIIANPDYENELKEGTGVVKMSSNALKMLLNKGKITDS